jgi:hypothetical protein
LKCWNKLPWQNTIRLFLESYLTKLSWDILDSKLVFQHCFLKETGCHPFLICKISIVINTIHNRQQISAHNTHFAVFISYLYFPWQLTMIFLFFHTVKANTYQKGGRNEHQR